MKILIISSEKRDDFSSTPSLLALALNAMEHKVMVWRNSFFENFKTPIVNLNKFKDEINDYDVVIATNSNGKVLDFTGINNRKIFLYYEAFDSPILPLGDFDEFWTGKSVLNLFRYCNPLRETPITTRLIVEPAIAPEYWKHSKAWKTRKIKVGYNGALQEIKDLDPLLHYWMIDRAKFCDELRKLLHKEGIGIRLPYMSRNEISKWKNDFRDTKINLHLSQEFGVGQGALEAGMNKCALVEYCPKDLAGEFGLINGKNCIVVENAKEAFEAIKRLVEYDGIAKELGEELFKFALKHTYFKFVPILKEMDF